MVNTAIETESMDVPFIEFGEDGEYTPDEVDDRYIDMAQIVLYAEVTLDVLAEKEQKEDFVADPDYVASLLAAIKTSKVVHEEADPGFCTDLTALDRDLLAAIRGDIVYLGPHFGIDLEVPVPEANDG